MLKVNFWRQILREANSLGVHLFPGIKLPFMWYRGGLSLRFGIETFLGHRGSAFCVRH